MIVENILPDNWMSKKTNYAFFLGSVYAIIGILIARIFFPSDPSLVAVAFTSILLLPLLRKIYYNTEQKEKKDTKFTYKHFWKNQGEFIKMYMLIAAGIFTIYCIASVTLPHFEVSNLFKSQISIRTGAGDAIAQEFYFTKDLFLDILANNWWVMVACILLSLFTGDGAIFLITWNASLWGTIFGVTARNAALFTEANPWFYLLLVLIIVLPHAIIEMLAYISGAITGGLISSDLELEEQERKEDRFKKTFYRYVLFTFIVALIFLLLGALLETFVLENVTLYRDIVIQSKL